MKNQYIGIDKLKVNNLIALCYAIDEFEELDEDLLYIISTKDSFKSISKLIKISNDKICFFAKKEKELYKRNKYILDLLKMYGELNSFLWDNYYKEGLNNYKGLKTFMNYIKEHRSDINLIINNLEKIRSLGFQTIRFSEELDFQKESYIVSKNLTENLCVEYVDNIEIIPNYDKQAIKYRTKDSNYKITIALSTDKISENNSFNSITLNSLIFKTESLPEKISDKHTFDKIIALSENTKRENIAVRDAVDLSIGIDELSIISDQISRKLDTMKTIDTKEDLINFLNRIKALIRQMKYLSDEHNQSISFIYTKITKDIIETEKKEYTKKRHL